MSRAPLHGSPTVLRGATHRYRLDHVLARGGTGHLWQATREADGASVAIKEVLLPPSPGVAKRVRAEVEIRRELTLPRVPRVHEAIEVPGGTWLPARLYLVQDLVVNARTLAALTQEGPATVGEALRMLDDVLGLLAAVHGHVSRTAPPRALTHGDVEPTNILRDGAGRYGLVDFGASALQGAARAVDAPDVGPTVYLPAHDWRSAPSVERDLYGLAVCTVSFLAGRPAEEWVVSERNIDWIGRLRASRQGLGLMALPPSLERLLLEMLGDSPRSAAELRKVARSIDPDASGEYVELRWVGFGAGGPVSPETEPPQSPDVRARWRRRMAHHVLATLATCVWPAMLLGMAWRWSLAVPPVADAAMAAALASAAAGVAGVWFRHRCVSKRGIRTRHAWLPALACFAASGLAWHAFQPEMWPWTGVAALCGLVTAATLFLISANDTLNCFFRLSKESLISISCFPAYWHDFFFSWFLAILLACILHGDFVAPFVLFYVFMCSFLLIYVFRYLRYSDDIRTKKNRTIFFVLLLLYLSDYIFQYGRADIFTFINLLFKVHHVIIIYIILCYVSTRVFIVTLIAFVATNLSVFYAYQSLSSSRSWMEYGRVPTLNLTGLERVKDIPIYSYILLFIFCICLIFAARYKPKNSNHAESIVIKTLFFVIVIVRSLIASLPAQD